MNKIEYILKELPGSAVSIYQCIKMNPGVSLDTINEKTGYSLVTIKRFIRTLKLAELIVVDCYNSYYAK